MRPSGQGDVRGLFQIFQGVGMVPHPSVQKLGHEVLAAICLRGQFQPARDPFQRGLRLVQKTVVADHEIVGPASAVTGTSNLGSRPCPRIWAGRFCAPMTLQYPGDCGKPGTASVWSPVTGRPPARTVTAGIPWVFYREAGERSSLAAIISLAADRCCSSHFRAL